MTSLRRVLSLALITGLAAPALAVATADPAAATTAVSGIAIDTTGQDGLTLSSSSYHSPDYVVTATPTFDNAYRFGTTPASSTASVGPQVTLTPPTGTSFSPGTYAVARYADATHAAIFMPGIGCQLEGTLALAAITTDPTDGHLTSLAADLMWRCAGAASYAFGTVRYFSTDYVAGSVTGTGGNTFLGGVGLPSAPVGQSPPPSTVTIRSTGTVPLVLGTAAMSDVNAADYAISNDSCSGATLQPAASCTLQVTVTPSATGTRYGRLEVPDNSPRGMRQFRFLASGYTTPGAPADLHAETATDGVWLTWNPPTDNGGQAVTSYQVLRGTATDNLAVIGTSPGYSYGDALSATTAAGTSYVYAVKAVNGAGAGRASGAVSAATPAAAVTPTATKVLTEDVETSAAPHAQNGRTLVQGVSTSVNYPGVQVTTTIPAGASYAQVLYVNPPTGTFVTAGTYPLAATQDATHASVSLNTPEGVGCTFASGTLSLPAFQRSSSGAAAIVDLDVSGSCTSGDTASASARVGVSRAYTGTAVGTADAGPLAVSKSKDVTVTYTNTGTSTLHVGTVTATGTDWSVGSPDSCSGATVAAGGSCSTTFTVTPTVPGARPGLAVFPDDSAVGTHTRDLTATGVVAPIAPANLGSSRSGGKVTLSWTDPGDSSQRATSFKVLRGTSAADATVLATVPAAANFGSTSYTDPDTADGPRYYEIRGVNAAGTGPGASVTLDLALRAPTNLYGTSTSRAGYLSWVAPTGEPKDPITGYAVYRGTSTTTMTKVATATTTHVTLPAIPGGTHAYFKVAAVTASGTGPYSAVYDVLGPTSQLVVAGADDSLNLSVAVRPLTGAPLSSPVVQDGQLHDQVSVSPNGVMVAYASGSYGDDIYVRRLDGTGTPVVIAASSADEYDPAWSLDGKTIAFTSSSSDVDTICKVPATGGSKVCVPRTGVSNPSWLNASTLVVTDESSAAAPLATMTFTSATLTPLLGTEGGFQPSVSPDGKKVAFDIAVSDTAVLARVYTIATKAVTAVQSPINEYLSTASWAHDGLSLYFTGNNQDYSSVYHAQADGSGTLSNVTGNHGFAFGVSVSTPDTTGPTVKLSGIPSSSLGPVTPRFSATDALNGVASYTLIYRKAAYNGSFGPSASLTLTTPRAIALSRGYTYCFSVKATDRVGNTSAATPEQCTVAPLDDRSLVRSSAFTPVTGSAYYASTAMKTTIRGATLTRTGMLSSRQLFVVATTCATCGTVDVLVGSTVVAHVNLASSTTVYKRIIALPSFTTRSGTVTLRVTSSGKTVLIDGLGVRK